ncbi:MAG: methylmalonyl Co-A mutase-associated GTPase MeaB [Chloroflexi bacterium]|nr:methylmalonyl Co-A mutase-associated GTPase MeaB [Chloroflexota bacterium]
MSLAQRILNGDRRAVARLITLVEDGAAEAEQELRDLYPRTGRAHVVGITGPPGSGKSTLARELAKEFRARSREVGIVAVDPSSPFTGGALLGDRVRMQELSTDPGVFIRSMATRGAVGGLAVAAADAARVLDALGCHVVILETVGAGQAEVDVAEAAQTTIVVEVPGMGDDIQASKAGILEIADIFVVNKADKDGADRAVVELESMLSFDTRHRLWTPPVVKTIATSGEGVKRLVDTVDAHLKFLRDAGELRRRLQGQARRELLRLVKQELLDRLLRQLPDGQLESLTQTIADRQIDPHSAARKLVEQFYPRRP